MERGKGVKGNGIDRKVESKQSSKCMRFSNVQKLQVALLLEKFDEKRFRDSLHRI